MATYHAIAAVGQAILDLLHAACPKQEFPNAEFLLYQASDFRKPPPQEGFSLCLYRVAINGPQRNRSARIGPDGRRFRPSLPLDMYYLLTPWAESAARQQRLLGFSMRVLEDTPILPLGLLNHAVPEAETFHASETVELLGEPLTLQDLSNLSELFKVTLPLSVAYVARMVAIDSTIELVDGRLVQTREAAWGKVSAG